MKGWLALFFLAPAFASADYERYVCTSSEPAIEIELQLQYSRHGDVFATSRYDDIELTSTENIAFITLEGWSDDQTKDAQLTLLPGENSPYETAVLIVQEKLARGKFKTTIANLTCLLKSQK